MPPGLSGSHLAKALAARGDELRVLARRSSDLGGIDGLEYERVTGDITDRRAIRRALDGAGKVFNVAGRTSLRAADREAVFAANLRGARTLFEEALDERRRARSSRPRPSARSASRSRAGTADESTPFEIGHLGLAYVNSKHEAELEAFRAAAHGLPIVIVNPTFVLGPDVPSGTRGSSMGLVRRFLRGQIPAYVDGGINVVDVRDVAAGHLLADEQGRGRRALHPRRPQLHLRPPVRRPLADLRRRAARDQASGRARGGRGRAFAERAGLPVNGGEVRSAALWWTYKNTKAKRELGFSPRPHEETLEDAVDWQVKALGDRVATGSPPLALRAGARCRRRGRITGR